MIILDEQKHALLVAAINAALEHCGPATRQILAAQFEAILKPAPEPVQQEKKK